MLSVGVSKRLDCWMNCVANGFLDAKSAYPSLMRFVI